jgi:hypothetical protein
MVAPGVKMHWLSVAGRHLDVILPLATISLIVPIVLLDLVAARFDKPSASVVRASSSMRRSCERH